MTIRINKISYGTITDRFLRDIDLNSHAMDAIIKILKRELKIPSIKRLRGTNYFFTFKMNKEKRKVISGLYIRRSSCKDFIKLTYEDMTSGGNGAHPNEFKVFLQGIRAKKCKDPMKYFDII